MDLFGATDLSAFSNVPVELEDGHMVGERVVRVAEIIRDYDPTLEIQWIPPHNRTDPNDPHFAIVAKPSGQPAYTVFYVKNESEMDERVLARLFEMDAAKQGNILNKIDAHNNAIRAIELKKKMDELEEAHDIAHHVLRSPKTRYRHNGVVYE